MSKPCVWRWQERYLEEGAWPVARQDAALAYRPAVGGKEARHHREDGNREARQLLAMQKEYLVELSDAVIAVRDAQGHIKLNQLINTTAAGAVSGAFWGTLIGLIFLMPLAGAALGAAGGALGGALTDVGLNDKWMKETAGAIRPGTAALFVLARKVTADKVLEGLKGEGGTVLKTSLDHTKEAALQAALAGVQAAVPASTAS
jgi:uncharacterized membrane protein